MRLIWHIIKKDAGRDRWALLVWGLLFAAQIGVGLVLLRHGGADKDWVASLQACGTALVFAQFATGYVLVTRFVQEDGLTDTRMFWVTRPISARRLLAAKALGVLVIFGLLPVLLLLPWWLYNDFGPREILWVAIETLGWQMLMIAPAFLLAALTDDLGRVLMWTLILITGLAAWTIFVQAKLKMALGGPAPSGNSGLLFTRLWLAAAVLVTGAAAIAIHQFLTRRFVRSVALTAPVLGLILLIGRAWPWDCSVLFVQLYQPAPAPLASADAFAGVQLDFGPAQIVDTDRFNGAKGEAQSWVRQTLEVRGVPEGLGIDYARAAQTWRWPGDPAGEQKSIQYSSYSDVALRRLLSLPAVQEDPETLRWQQERRNKQNAERVARGLQPWLPYPSRAQTSDYTLTAYTLLPDSLIARIQSQPPASVIRLQGEISRGQVLFELPLKPGARGSGDAQIYRITDVLHSGENATARVVLSTPALRGNGLWGVIAIDPASRDALPQSLATVNRTEGNCNSGNLGYEGGVVVKALIGGVNLRWARLGVTPRQVIRNGEWVPHDPDWFEHTTVVMLAEKPVARLTREVKTEKFELEPGMPDKPKPYKSL